MKRVMPLQHALSLRRAVSADIPAMSTIRLAVAENTLSDPTRITPAMYEDFLENAGRGWVAEHDGQVVAFCYADQAKGSIWALFVRPDNEGKGLGRALLEQASDWLFASGHEAIHLTTGAGTRADRFYAKQGWLRSVENANDVGYTLMKSRKVE